MLHVCVHLLISDEWYSVSSSDNSRKTSSKKLNSNYPTITVDDDDDIIEIRDLGSKRRLPQHTSTPAENGFKRNGNTTSAYFGSANAPSLGIRRPSEYTKLSLVRFKILANFVSEFF